MQEIKLPPTAHGFKLSAMFNDRLYFYPNEEYKMDMIKIKPGRWVVHSSVRFKNYVCVYLKPINH